MGGGGKGNAFIDHAMRMAEEKRLKAVARAETVPIEDKKRIMAAGTKRRTSGKKGRGSTLLHKAEDTLGVA